MKKQDVMLTNPTYIIWHIVCVSQQSDFYDKGLEKMTTLSTHIEMLPFSISHSM